MSDLTENQSNKRRRLKGKPSEQSLRITDLSEDLIKACLSFVGPGHYRLVASTCKSFAKQYAFTKKTTWQSAAASLSCAKFCLDDSEAKAYAVEMIANGAASIGQIKVIQWTYDDCAYRLDKFDFVRAGEGGHLNVLKWGEERGLEWYSENLCNRAAENGHLPVLKWLHQQEQPTEWFAYYSACNGHLHVLQWMEEQNLILVDDHYAWFAAAMYGHYHVLKWLQENGFTNIRESVHGAAQGGRIDILLWCREQGCEWNTETCSVAACHGQLGTLKWLRENNVPWDSDTICFAEIFGHYHVAEWARANGCPEPATY